MIVPSAQNVNELGDWASLKRQDNSLPMTRMTSHPVAK